MYLIPLVRANRAIAASLLYPQHPVQAIAATEIISVFGPLLNPKMYTKIIALTIAMMYNPSFSHFFIQNYQKTQNYYYQAEICTSLLFILALAFQYI
tara:strand:- start:2586 stop:2876 length:291 start_codon:yes stop_codon:yes gene_type:complete